MGNIFTRVPSIIYQNLMNFPGWRTRRKLLVIESDDWGSIRMPSVEVYEKFALHGLNLSNTDYNRIDTLESNDDLTMLYEVLLKHKDINGRHPVITANTVVGNPDFLRIKDSNFTEYFFEPVIETLKRYHNRDKVKELWLQGISLGIFHPQFHGREHVNVPRWMEALNMKTPEIMFTFNNSTTFSGEGDYNFMEVLDYNTPQDLELMKKSIVEGLDNFETIFGYRSRSFIPPCYTWSSEIEKTLAQCNVNYIQGLVVQYIPKGSFGNYYRKYHFLGQKNNHGQLFLIRNCFFEPALTKSGNPIDECLRRIHIAFRWYKPAVVCSHRINFIGALDEKNRSKNLFLLSDLLNRIIVLWPDIEFITSDQLGDIIAGVNTD